MEGIGDLLLLAEGGLLLAAAGDRLSQLLGGEAANFPLLLPLLWLLSSLLVGLLLPAPTNLPLLLPLLQLFSLLPALLPLLLSPLPTEVLLLGVLLPGAVGGGKG